MESRDRNSSAPENFRSSACMTTGNSSAAGIANRAPIQSNYITQGARMAPHKVALIGWDAADWKVIRPLMDAGHLPNVQRLIGNGATGAIATLHPPLSPMLWTSIATGMRP